MQFMLMGVLPRSAVKRINTVKNLSLNQKAYHSHYNCSMCQVS